MRFLMCLNNALLLALEISSRVVLARDETGSLRLLFRVRSNIDVTANSLIQSLPICCSLPRV